MQKAIWTVVSLVLAAAALFPMVANAGIMSPRNHNETLVRDTAAK